jgi:hypothetical protein
MKEEPMGAEWITHKGKKILYIRYSGISPSEQLDLIRAATKILLETGVKDNLTLTDVTNTFVSKEFVELAKEKGGESKEVTKKAAIIGIEGIRKLLLHVVNTVSGNSRKPFNSIEEAKDWLVE